MVEQKQRPTKFDSEKRAHTSKEQKIRCLNCYRLFNNWTGYVCDFTSISDRTFQHTLTYVIVSNSFWSEIDLNIVSEIQIRKWTGNGYLHSVRCWLKQLLMAVSKTLSMYWDILRCSTTVYIWLWRRNIFIENDCWNIIIHKQSLNRFLEIEFQNLLRTEKRTWV